jgi:hypothetical protein
MTMIKPLCFILTVMLSPAEPQRRSFEEVQAAAERQNAQDPSAAPQMGSKDRDPFYRDWLDFQQNNAAWEQLEERLDEALSGVSACDPRSAAEVGRVKDAAFRAINAQGGYFRKWTSYASENIQAFRQAMQSRTGLRREIELSLGDVERQRAELVERRRTLEQELRTSKTESDGRELKALDRLIASADERSANFKQALATWDEAGRNGVQTIEAAELLKAKVAAHQRLLESSTALWQAYYNAAESRLSLKCWRDELQPQDPVIRKPRFSQEVR